LGRRTGREQRRFVADHPGVAPYGSEWKLEQARLTRAWNTFPNDPATS
jgi:hypothetical protein